MESATSIPPEHDPAFAESVQRGHEVRDARLRPVVLFVVIMFGAIILIQIGLIFLQRHDTAANRKRYDSPDIFANQRPVPPEPNLQPSPAHPEVPMTDMEKLTSRWQQELTTSGDSAAGPGFVRIPVDQAINHAVEHGLPKPPPATTQAKGGAQ